MDDEAAHHLLRKVSSAGVRHGTAEPAPKSMSWEEFLRQPTAAERASADARAQRGSPPSASDANPTSLRDSRRRRRRAHTVSSTNERPRVHNLALTYDVTAPDEPRSDSPRSPEVATAEASEELALIRDLLEQLVRSQQRIESRLEAVERNTSRRQESDRVDTALARAAPRAQQTCLQERVRRAPAACARPRPAPAASELDESAPPRIELNLAATRGDDESRNAGLFRAPLLLVAQRQRGQLNRFSELERRTRQPDRRPTSLRVSRVNEERGPPACREFERPDAPKTPGR